MSESTSDSAASLPQQLKRIAAYLRGEGDEHVLQKDMAETVRSAADALERAGECDEQRVRDLTKWIERAEKAEACTPSPPLRQDQEELRRLISWWESWLNGVIGEAAVPVDELRTLVAAASRSLAPEPTHKESEMSEVVTRVPDERAPIEHELKTWQSYFHAIENGAKLFEIRRDDRGFRVGDTLRLRETEYGSGKYTGREARRKITYILRHEEDLGLMDGFAILSLAPEPILTGEVGEMVAKLRDELPAQGMSLRTERQKAADLLSRLSAVREEAVVVLADVLGAWREAYGYLGAVAMEGRPEAARLANSVDAAIKRALKSAAGSGSPK